MKYTPKERLEIGRIVYCKELTQAEAEIKYQVGRTCIQNYVKKYREANGLPKLTRPHATDAASVTFCGQQDSKDYASMSREELIDALIRSRINETCAKKGYIVKGDGTQKVYEALDSKNTK